MKDRHTLLSRFREEQLVFAEELRIRDFFCRQMPALAISFVIAELFYKFHSFTLECGAFLATWFALDAIIQGVATLALAAKKRKAEAAP
jgi:hypothetical protein